MSIGDSDDDKADLVVCDGIADVISMVVVGMLVLIFCPVVITEVVGGEASDWLGPEVAVFTAVTLDLPSPIIVVGASVVVSMSTAPGVV